MNDSGDKSKQLGGDRRTDRDVARTFARDDLIGQALKRAVRDALLMHKRLGNPVASWKDGQVVWIPPEEIEVAGVDDEPHPRR